MVAMVLAGFLVRMCSVLSSEAPFWLGAPCGSVLPFLPFSDFSLVCNIPWDACG